MWNIDPFHSSSILEGALKRMKRLVLVTVTPTAFVVPLATLRGEIAFMATAAFHMNMNTLITDQSHPWLL